MIYEITPSVNENEYDLSIYTLLIFKQELHKFPSLHLKTQETF